MHTVNVGGFPLYFRFIVHLPETTVPPNHFINLICTDADTPVHGTLTYEVLNEQDFSMFEITLANGRITLLDNLDYDAGNCNSITNNRIYLLDNVTKILAPMENYLSSFVR